MLIVKVNKWRNLSIGSNSSFSTLKSIGVSLISLTLILPLAVLVSVAPLVIT